MLKRRSVPLSMFLSLITFGLYGLYWMACLTREVAKETGEMTHRGGWLAMFAGLFTYQLYSTYWFYRVPVRLNELRKAAGLRAQEVSKGVWIFVLSLASHIASVVWTLACLRDPEVLRSLSGWHDGTPDVMAVLVFWGIIWLACQVVFLIPALFAAVSFETKPQTNWAMMCFFGGIMFAVPILQMNVNDYLLFKARQRRGVFSEVPDYGQY